MWEEYTINLLNYVIRRGRCQRRRKRKNVDDNNDDDNDDDDNGYGQVRVI